MNCRIEAVSGAAAVSLAAPLAEMHAGCFPDDPWPSQAIAEIMGLAGFFGRIAFADHDPAGFALAQSLGEECEVLSLGVVPGHRCAGIGSALLAALCAEARRRGARRLFLEVAADNTAARALYGAHGFVQVGRRRDYYRRGARLVDALVLRLLLST
jgi:[ribosomal protein S18]-alanine N-acetyltransferase